jgi:hypothetical protein
LAETLQVQPALYGVSDTNMPLHLQAGCWRVYQSPQLLLAVLLAPLLPCCCCCCYCQQVRLLPLLLLLLPLLLLPLLLLLLPPSALLHEYMRQQFLAEEPHPPGSFHLLTLGH